MRFAGEEEFAFAGQHLDQRLLSGSVFRQLLAFPKTKEQDAAIRGAQQRAADDSVCGELRFVGQRQDFRRATIITRLFVHAVTLDGLLKGRFDGGQCFAKLWKS